MQTRIYVVQHGENRRLVEASSQSQAIWHCVRHAYAAKIAAPKELASLMSTGLTVEVAKSETKGPHAQTNEGEQ